ncbi:MAG: hypothetical protein QNL33_02800 [Akkermansiaceae bacterium]
MWESFQIRRRFGRQDLLEHYEYLFESPLSEKGDPQGMAVFWKRE